MAAVSRREQPSSPGLVRFLRETSDELRKVTWPSGAELYRYTVVVLVTVVAIALFIGGVDYVLSQGVRHLIYGGL